VILLEDCADIDDRVDVSDVNCVFPYRRILRLGEERAQGADAGVWRRGILGSRKGEEAPAAIRPDQMTEMNRHGVRQADDRRGMQACIDDALSIVSKAPGGFAVTFDVDSIDPRFAPGSGTLVRGGLTYRESHLALETIAAHGGMLSFEIVEVNPMLDQSNITVELACELILSALGKTIL